MYKFIRLIVILFFISILFPCLALASFTQLDTDYQGGAARDVYSDGTYVYLANNGGGILSYTFNGSTLTYKHTEAASGSYITDIWGDGTYLYVCDDDGFGSGGGLHTYTYNGSSFTKIDTDDQGGIYHSVHGDGTYIYVAANAYGLLAYSQSSGILSYINRVDVGTVEGVWCQDGYIYAAWGDAIRSYTFNGSAFSSPVDAEAIDDDGKDIWGDGTYIYLASKAGDDSTGNLRVYSVSSGDMTLAATSETFLSSALDVWGDGTYIYVANSTYGLRAYTWDGSTLEQVGRIAYGYGYGIFGDGTYLYFADWSDGLVALREFEVPAISSVSGTISDGETITIAGTGFGTKGTATPAVFDNFDSNDTGRENTDEIKNENCSHYGTWNDEDKGEAYSYTPIYTNANQRTGSTLSSYHHFNIGGGDGSNYAWCQIDFSASHEPILLITFWERALDVSLDPAPSGSSNIKAWTISDGGVNYGRHTVESVQVDHRFYWALYTLNSIWPTDGDQSMNISSDDADDAGVWYQTILMIKAGSDGALDGEMRVWVNGVEYENTIVMETWDSAESDWIALTFGLFSSNFTSGDYYLQFDDIYVDDTWQSVWVGNNAAWDSCTHREIQIHKTWSDTGLTFEFNQGSFVDSDTVYVFIMDGDGNASTGEELTSGTRATGVSGRGFSFQ